MRCVTARAEGVHHRPKVDITHEVRISFRKERITQKSLFCLVDKRDFFVGGDGGIRTLDLTDANRTLSQLSYAPVCLLVSLKHYITNFPFVKKNIDYIENL